MVADELAEAGGAGQASGSTSGAMGRTVGLIQSERECHGQGIDLGVCGIATSPPHSSSSSRVYDQDHRLWRRADLGSDVNTDTPAPRP